MSNTDAINKPDANNAHLVGLEPNFASQVEDFLNESNGRFTVASGLRTPQQQQQLYENAVMTHGPTRARQLVGTPGSSNHEKGTAIDVQGNLELAAQLAHRFGLYQPMPHEPWHFEPYGNQHLSDEGAYTQPPEGDTNVTA